MRWLSRAARPRGEVLAWADAWLLWDERLYDGPLLDLSLGRRLHVEDLVGLLRTVPGEVEPVRMWGLAFGWMLRALNDEPSLDFAFAEAVMRWQRASPPGFAATGFESLRYDYYRGYYGPDEDKPGEQLQARARAELRAELTAARDLALSPDPSS